VEKLLLFIIDTNSLFVTGQSHAQCLEIRFWGNS